MKIYELQSNISNYETFQLKDYEKTFDHIQSLLYSHDHVHHMWKDVSLTREDEGEESDFPLFWGLPGMLLVSERAKKLLAPDFKEQVEFLQASSNNHPYYFLKTAQFFDVVDIEASDLKILKSGIVSKINKLVFRSENIPENNIFRVSIKDKPVYRKTFVNEKVYNMIVDSDLKGYKFLEIELS